MQARTTSVLISSMRMTRLPDVEGWEGDLSVDPLSIQLRKNRRVSNIEHPLIQRQDGLLDVKSKLSVVGVFGGH